MKSPPSDLLYRPNRAGFAQLHSAIEPYDAGWLDVGDGHRVYWEVSGNPQGEAALLVHGGPGGAIRPRDRRFFDPGRYRIIAFDQRGCGRSMPQGELHANTTAHLIDDMERLRIHLGISQWLLWGGSWGATLALAYAQTHPARVRRLVLRGVFLARRNELHWLYQGGAAAMHPQAWQAFIQPLAASQRHDVLGAYAAVLTGAKSDAALAMAQSWCAWEDALMGGAPGTLEDGQAWTMARLSAHYLAHGAFLEEGALIARAACLKGVPGVIVQGRYDLVTPTATAWALHQAWPESALYIVAGAGHASDEPGITRILLESVDADA